MKNKKYLFLIISLVLFLVALCVILIVEHQKNKDKEISEIHKVFTNDYAFSSSKNKDNLKITMDNLDDAFFDDFKHLLSQINGLPIQIQNQDKLESLLQSKYYIYYLDNPDLKQGLKKYDQINQENFIRDNIKFEFLMEDKDSYIDYKNLIYNIFDGNLLRYFYQKIDNFAVINLYAKLYAQIERDGTLSNMYLKYSFIDDIKIKRTMQCNNYSINDFSNNLYNKKDILYRLEFIGDGAFDESPDLNDWEIDEEAKIKVDNYFIEYVYLDEKNVLVPLLRVNGSIEDNDIIFWIWIIEKCR